MNRQEEVHNGYKRGAKSYDNLLSTKRLWAKLACKLVWGFPDTAYTNKLLDCIPDDFGGKLLDIPVGTALFTAPKYQHMKNAKITCMDYSEDMMNFAQQKFQSAGINNVTCLQGDVGNLPFQDASFDRVLSMNGFHAFPDKEAAFRETSRVLKDGGSFIGCFYIKGEVKRTDWFVNHIYVPKGYFIPPFLTKSDLEKKLHAIYHTVEIWNIGSIACFRCTQKHNSPDKLLRHTLAKDSTCCDYY